MMPVQASPPPLPVTLLVAFWIRLGPCSSPEVPVLQRDNGKLFLDRDLPVGAAPWDYPDPDFTLVTRQWRTRRTPNPRRTQDLRRTRRTPDLRGTLNIGNMEPNQTTGLEFLEVTKLTNHIEDSFKIKHREEDSTPRADQAFKIKHKHKERAADGVRSIKAQSVKKTVDGVRSRKEESVKETAAVQRQMQEDEGVRSGAVVPSLTRPQPATNATNYDCHGCQEGQRCECTKDSVAGSYAVDGGLRRTTGPDNAAWAAAALGFLLVLLTLSVLHTRLYRHCRTRPSLYWYDPQQDYESVADVISRRIQIAKRRQRRSRRPECVLLLSSSSDENL